MFYNLVTFSRHGPLAKIWLAAHWEKKLTRQQILESNLDAAVQQVIRPTAKISLRTTSHLLLGIVRIYSKKTGFLLVDTEELFCRVKQTAAQRIGFIPFIEPFPRASLPGPNDPNVNPPITEERTLSPSKEVGRGRAEDITLIEDDFETVAQFHPVCSDDFGEWEAIVTDSNQAPLPSFNPPFAATTPFRVPSPALPNDFAGGDGWDIMPPDNNPDDMAEFESERARKSVNLITPNISFPPPLPLEQDQDEELPSEADQMPIARTSILNSKEPTPRPPSPSLVHAKFHQSDPNMDEEDSERGSQPGVNRRNRELRIDRVKEISQERMERNAHDYRDTIQKMALGPPTLRLMRASAEGSLHSLNNRPVAIRVRHSNPILQLYRGTLDRLREREEKKRRRYTSAGDPRESQPNTPLVVNQDDLNEEIRYARTEVVDLEDDAAALPYGRTETLEVEAEKTPTPPPPEYPFLPPTPIPSRPESPVTPSSTWAERCRELFEGVQREQQCSPDGDDEMVGSVIVFDI
ncbi:hypothetical protein WR25_07697 isoform B [Diploscapter pachys]|uniref:Rad21/Rec8-like protein N-terminal domain-containing protein n=1 Tax=Diploscapter pachys TaxID=2018661 RepID=A0A2A2JNZ4_9BILA|nr:hypothetical protein WR25_07697 isoform B [Diploscapter pachys]